MVGAEGRGMEQKGLLDSLVDHCELRLPKKMKAFAFRIDRTRKLLKWRVRGV